VPLFWKLNPLPDGFFRRAASASTQSRQGALRPVTPVAIRFKPQTLERFATCPFRESVTIWFSFLVERTNSQLTERTKKMNSENIKKITNQAIEQLITALNAGRSETLTQYLAAIGRFHRYSLRNVMLIASQKPTASHVAGFHAWHKLGRFVKKGEKGIVILAPIVRRKNECAKQGEGRLRCFRDKVIRKRGQDGCGFSGQ
jgi:hypothetical protein